MSDATPTSSKIKLSWLIGVLAAFGIFAVIAAYSSRMTHDYAGYDQQRAKERADIRAKVDEEQAAQLNKLDWVDREEKVVTLPIEQAMTAEIDTLKKKPVKQGAAIPVAAPAPAATNAPAAAAPEAPKK